MGSHKFERGRKSGSHREGREESGAAEGREETKKQWAATGKKKREEK